MKSIDELKALSISDLEAKVISLRKEQFDLRMKKSNGTLEGTHHFAALKKAIAQAKTLITQKRSK